MGRGVTCAWWRRRPTAPETTAGVATTHSKRKSSFPATRRPAGQSAHWRAVQCSRQLGVGCGSTLRRESGRVCVDDAKAKAKARTCKKRRTLHTSTHAKQRSAVYLKLTMVATPSTIRGVRPTRRPVCANTSPSAPRRRTRSCFPVAVVFLFEAHCHYSPDGSGKQHQ